MGVGKWGVPLWEWVPWWKLWLKLPGKPWALPACKGSFDCVNRFAKRETVYSAQDDNVYFEFGMTMCVLREELRRADEV
jgi:hypothetical protein